MPVVRLLLVAAVAATTLSVSDTTTPVAASVPEVSLLIEHDGSTGDIAAEVRAEVGADNSENLPRVEAIRVDVPADEVAETIGALEDIDGVDDVVVDPIMTAQVLPNDPHYPLQWGTRSIRGDVAWSTTVGSADTVIAVLDSGVAWTPDLAGRIIDGWDFVGDSSDAADDNGHGSDVATIAAGSGSDGLGIAGMCWRCKVMPVKVLSAGGAGYLSDIVKGIIWAADHGADVINLSLGGAQTSQALTDAVAYARSRGAVLVAAAGNEGVTTPTYPAATPGVIGVAASTEGNGTYWWSNRGADWVDVTAPGCNPASASADPRNFCGTSSSAPLVSGLAALVMSEHPHLTPTEITDAITDSAQQLHDPTIVEHGKVDAPRALAEAAYPGTGVPTGPLPPPPPGDEPPDTQRPIGWIVPADGLIEGNHRIEVAADDDRAVASAQLLVNGVPFGTKKPRGKIAAFDVPTRTMRDGLVEFSAVITDTAGNRMTTAPMTAFVDNYGPWHVISSPHHNSSVGNRVTVDMAVWDGNSSWFSLLVAEGRFVGLALGNGFFSFDVELHGRGPIEIAAIGIDHFGHIGISNRVTVHR